MKINISIVIVNYNTKEYLLNCIKSIFESQYNGRLEIVVVDNNSNDNSIALIEKIDKNITIIKNNDNLGFSQAVNIGLKKCNGKYICILNPDTVLKSNCLIRLKEYMDSNSIPYRLTCFTINIKIRRAIGGLELVLV